jgi:hypothetical protein
MTFRILADLVAVAHLLFVLFVVLGGLLVLRWRWLLWLHLPAAVWGIAVELGGWVCPLTPLENRLRALAGARGYAGGFIDHYLLPLLYPARLTRATQIGLGIAVLLLNGGIYWLVLRHRSRQPR